MAAERRPPPPRLSLSVQLGDEIDELPASRARLRRWVAAAIERDAHIVLRFVGTREGRALNAAYRDRGYATNVLTFAYDEPEGVRADIAICLPVVLREVRERRGTPEAHLAHLVVHGVLHAHGHEHDTDEGAARMQTRESALLARFGLPDPWG